MKTFPVHSIESAPESSVPFLEQTNKKFGFVPNLIGIMASSSAVTEAYLAVDDIFSRSSLTPTEQQIVLLTISHFHECRYCVAAHTAISGMLNVEPAIVNAIRENLPLSDPKLQVFREFALAIVENRGWVSDELKSNFISAGYTQGNMLDILVGVAQKTLSNFTNHLASTPLDSQFAQAEWEPNKKTA